MCIVCGAVCVGRYIHTFSTYIHTDYRHTDIQTYRHTYTHTYIHTYIHTYTPTCGIGVKVSLGLEGQGVTTTPGPALFNC